MTNYGPRESATCPKCGLRSKQLHTHRPPCDRTPIPEELARIFDNETNMSLVDLAKRFSVGYDFIALRLRGTSWTKERIAKRGQATRVAKQRASGRKLFVSESRLHPQCECGILMKNGEKRCDWCKMEKHGVTDYHVLLEVGAI